MESSQYTVVTPTKSAGTSIILTVLFGSLGMFYSTILGGIIMSIVSGIVLLISIMTLGLGLVLYLIVWPIEIIWAVVAVNSYNSRLTSGKRI